MDWQEIFTQNWPVWLVGIVLIVAAWIDGKQLRVPNWLTYPMALAGLIYNTSINGWEGLGFGLWGMVVGLLCLLPLYAVGGMGAGDVKLMGGMGAWLGWETTLYAYVVSVMVGAVIAIGMALYKRDFRKHYANFIAIFLEWIEIKNPAELSKIAAERKPKMLLLPYGIPICIGSIAYFVYEGLLF